MESSVTFSSLRRSEDGCNSRLYTYTTDCFKLQYCILNLPLPVSKNAVYFVLRIFASTKKQSSPATRQGGAWGRGSIAPTHSLPRH
jgi:hypothetical protein